MGFTTGFTGGVTLTLGLAYLTVISHERNRQSQALYLRSQSQLLNSLLDPAPVQPSSRAELARQSRSTFTEAAKDRWNEEVENAVRWVQTTDWNGVREGMEGAVARILGLGLQKSRESIVEAEKQARPKVQEAVDRSRAAARKGVDQVTATVDMAAAATITGAERASEAAKSSLETLATSTKEGVHRAGVKTQDAASTVTAGAAGTKASIDHAATASSGAIDRIVEKNHEMVEKARTEAQSTRAGTVDAARGTLRNVVNKGIEKGKEVITKAQAAAGLATEKIESMSKSNDSESAVSDVEKALRERYEQPKGFDKTVEEILEERYRPIDQSNNTVLRAV